MSVAPITLYCPALSPSTLTEERKLAGRLRLSSLVVCYSGARFTFRCPRGHGARLGYSAATKSGRPWRAINNREVREGPLHQIAFLAGCSARAAKRGNDRPLADHAAV